MVKNNKLSATDEHILMVISNEDILKKVIFYIKESPGIIQSALYKFFPLHIKNNISTIIYCLSKAGFISREKIGNSYRLYIAKELETIDEAIKRTTNFIIERQSPKVINYKNIDLINNERYITKNPKERFWYKKLCAYLGEERIEKITLEFNQSKLTYDITGGFEYFLSGRIANGIYCKFNPPLLQTINKYWSDKCTNELKQFLVKYGFCATKTFVHSRLKEILGEERYDEFFKELTEEKDLFYVELCGKYSAFFPLQSREIPYLYADYLRFKLCLKPEIVIKQCKYCKRFFTPLILSECSIIKYYPIKETINEVNYCGACLDLRWSNQKRSTKEEMVAHLKRLIEIIGYIPSRNFLNNPTFLKGISTDKFDETMKILIEIPPYDMRYGAFNTYKNVFGSWLETLMACKILEGNVFKTERGYMCLAKDRHQCHSLAEKSIDDWFFKHNIEHTKEPHYPRDEDFNPHNLSRADWKIGNVYIEYWGLQGSENYDKRVLLKKSLCKNQGLTLFEIYPKDISNLSNKLKIFQQNKFIKIK